jgi:arylsulfatase A-like enzyme
MVRPDIVLIVLDTQRADRLSCYGYPLNTSPHLDALATEATRFSHAIAPAQWTIPSHASMFTGLYPSQHTMFQLDSLLPDTIPTLAERLQQAGYFTAGFSNNPLIGLQKNGLQRGFDMFLNSRYDQHGGLLSFRSPPLDSQANFPSVQRLRNVLIKFLKSFQKRLARCEVVNQIMLSPLIFPSWDAASKLKRSSELYTGQALDEAAQLLIERPAMATGQPIFVFINLMGVHIPYQPPRWAVKKFVPQLLQSKTAQRFLKIINSIQNHPDYWLGDNLLDDEQKALLDGVYDAEVAAQDAQIGIFMQRLRQAGVFDDILLMVVADHGEHLGEKQMISHIFGAYSALCHVPLLIRDPSGQLPLGTTVSPFVSSRRLFHTALTVAGTATPTEEALSLTELKCSEYNMAFTESKPFDLLLQKMAALRPGVLQEYGYSKLCRALYHDSYKLIATGAERIELYAIREDPSESFDLRHTEPHRVQALQRQLAQFIEEMQPVAPSMTYQENDPVIMQRLRELGYLE